jgi:hypothetical protein
MCKDRCNVCGLRVKHKHHYPGPINYNMQYDEYGNFWIWQPIPHKYGQCPYCGGNLTLDHKCPMKKESNMNTKICGTCEWYKLMSCTLNPQTVKKASMDSCSHWTPKTLNEVKND